MSEAVSIFDRIVEVEEAKKLRGFDVEEELGYLFACPKLKKARDKEVLIARHGLNGDHPKTLEEIGRELKVTRERVRQIEKSATKKLVDYAKVEKRTQKAFQIIKEQVDKDGGTATNLRLYDLFLGEGNKSSKAKNQLVFFLTLNNNFKLINETALSKKGLSSKFSLKEVENIIDHSTSILEKEKKPIEETKFLASVKDSIGIKLSENEIRAAITLAKNIIRTEEGHLGLAHWREINPKSIRDKTYYILRKHQKPLHFEDIAQHIENLDQNKKKVTKQAVHNELIRDERFVLIGRGIYALKEWGYKNGVVEEVIEEILITAGKPMHKDAIIKEVMKQRIVKETTILLNLQKDKFTRVARATYTVKKQRG
ncbi:MAG: sigma factor-like helix-turn-helix DNA-binding protein [Patescibacteria group bacterium]|nr:sigma factor-like helix-turn-helix DNA-binding protein [Patescibacteria group bacterium]